MESEGSGESEESRVQEVFQEATGLATCRSEKDHIRSLGQIFVLEEKEADELLSGNTTDARAVNSLDRRLGNWRLWDLVLLGLRSCTV